MVLVPQWN